MRSETLGNDPNGDFLRPGVTASAMEVLARRRAAGGEVGRAPAPAAAAPTEGVDAAALAHQQRLAEAADADDGSTPAKKRIERVWRRGLASAEQRLGRPVSAGPFDQPDAVALQALNLARLAEARYLQLASAGAHKADLEGAFNRFSTALVNWLNRVTGGAVAQPDDDDLSPGAAILDVILLRHGKSEHTALPDDLRRISVAAGSVAEAAAAAGARKLARTHYIAELVPTASYSRIESLIGARAREVADDVDDLARGREAFVRRGRR